MILDLNVSRKLAADAKLAITPEGTLVDGKPLISESQSLRPTLRRFAGTQPRRLPVLVDPDSTVEGLLSVLGAIDNPCVEAEDCGLLGIGFSFALRPQPR